MGAFLLAASGLLDGHRATTHWRFAHRLQMRYPAVRVDGDRIFTGEDGIWTSRRNDRGIDMTLALIGEDIGEEVAARGRAHDGRLLQAARRPNAVFLAARTSIRAPITFAPC